MKIVVELELDETWTPGEEEEITNKQIIQQAIILAPGIRMKLVYVTREYDKEWDLIETLVCNFCDVEPEELKHKTRKREVVEARQICHYIAKDKGLGSLASIGFRFGRKDHATVIYSNRIITTLLKTDKAFKNQYKDFIESFK